MFVLWCITTLTVGGVTHTCVTYVLLLGPGPEPLGLSVDTHQISIMGSFRYKPFFPVQVQTQLEAACTLDLCVQDRRLVDGRLRVTLMECSR